MPLTPEGLVVQTYKEILNDIIAEEQINVSPQIEVGDDTALGETNKIVAAQIAKLTELIQDVYDQRSLYHSEGKALDDNVSWLGITRLGATATYGTQFFVGTDGITIPANSFVRNSTNQENYTTDAAVTITRNACRKIVISVSTVDDTGYNYTVSVKGIFSIYTSQNGDTAQDIAAGIAAQITLDTDSTYSVTDNLDGTLLIEATDDFDKAVTIDANLSVDEVTSAGRITGVNTGVLPAPANTVTIILSPTNGWTSTYNPNAFILGRERETDAELRARAVLIRGSTGKATVDAIKAAILQVDGVSSVAVNERFVSQGVDNSVIDVATVLDSTLYTTTINGDVYQIDSVWVQQTSPLQRL